MGRIRKWGRWLLALAATAGSIGAYAGRAQAQGLDVEDWLRRPGTKLLAVEFFATWCKPCMEAVPRWRALHDKYRAQGLRFVVIATQDADGSCSNPGWTPDAVICDDDGRLARRFGANRLPSAFLWSWQGSLLAKESHIDDIESKVRAWMRSAPRVEVEVSRVAPEAGITNAELRNSVRAELRGTDKLVVVATAAERKKLRELVKQSLARTADDALACKVGAEVTPNSLLKVSVSRGSTPRLRLQLLSAERGCLVASSSAVWRKNNAPAGVREAVDKLISRLRRSPQYPWSTRASAAASPPTDYAAILKQAERAQKNDRARKERLDSAWVAVSKAAKSTGIDRQTRIQYLEQFVSDFPADNPHLRTAQSYLSQLRSGRDIASASASAPTPPAPATVPPTRRSANGGQPEWVMRGSGTVPGDKNVFYAVGVQSGIRNKSMLRRAADHQARAEMMKLVQVYTTSVVEDYASSGASGRRSSSDKQRIHMATKTLSTGLLQGVQIVDHWLDPQDGTMYALARLDVGRVLNRIDEAPSLNGPLRARIRRSAKRALSKLRL